MFLNTPKHELAELALWVIFWACMAYLEVH